MRTRLIHPKRSFIRRHSVTAPHGTMLSFYSHGLLHCMRIGTNFSTRIRLAEMVFSTTQVSHTSRHATPKHASWFNMAEIEIGVMDRQCIGGRLASEAMLKSEGAAWKH